MHGNTSKPTCLAAFLGLERLVKYAHSASSVIEGGPCRRLEIERPINNRNYNIQFYILLFWN